VRKFNLDKPNPIYKHMPKWVEADSEKMIWNLHRIEKQIRHEILVEQVSLMPNGLMAQRLKANGETPKLLMGKRG